MEQHMAGNEPHSPLATIYGRLRDGMREGSPRTPDHDRTSFDMGEGHDRSHSEDGFDRLTRADLQRQGSQPHRPRKQSNGQGSQSSDDTSPRSPLYKTELCRSFEETHQCRYGNKCQFAHGHHEIRPIARHPRYKTEYCKTFSMHGTCPYGKRCRFVHESLANQNANQGGIALMSPSSSTSGMQSPRMMSSPRMMPSSPDMRRGHGSNASPRGREALDFVSPPRVSHSQAQFAHSPQGSQGANEFMSPRQGPVARGSPSMTSTPQSLENAEVLELRGDGEAPGTPNRSRLAIFRKLTVDDELEALETAGLAVLTIAGATAGAGAGTPVRNRDPAGSSS